MKICEAGRSSGCCRNPDIRTINTMGADTAGNFEIRAGAGVGITAETNGIRIAYTGGITVYTNTDGNIVIDNDLFTMNLADDITITGDMIIAGDLTVNGTYYTVHAEHVYTEDDYIIMREGAVTGLGSGDYSGFQVTKYDGTNDGRLVIDNAGTARVGDVGDEQPLLTREESANLTDGAILKWDAANMKAVDEGTVGSDTKPIKIVNGVATPVANDLASASSVTPTFTTKTMLNSSTPGSIVVTQIGKLVIVNVRGCTPTGSGNVVICDTLPKASIYVGGHTNAISNNTPIGNMWIDANETRLYVTVTANLQFWGQVIYATD